MSKFKVGDRVRFREDFGSYPAGFVAYVHRLDHDGDPEICTPNGEADNFCTDTLLELADIISGATANPTTLTRRDHFAMAALTGFLAFPECEGSYEYIAEQVYRIANAMEAARNKEGAK